MSAQRSKGKILHEVESKGAMPKYILEVLLDIRELLTKLLKGQK